MKNIDKDKKLIDDFINHLKNPKTTMTKEKLLKLKKEVLESLSNDRRSLVMKEPFVGGVIMKFDLVPIRDYRCGTAMTDGSRIYFDIDFYKNLNEQERIFVLAHECWHCIYMHFLRKRKRIGNIWNIATDCEINYMLKNQGFISPENLCYPEREDEGKNAEDIYERLLKKMKKNQKNQNNEDSESVGNSKNSSSGSSGSNSKEKTKSKKGLDGQFDKHVTDDDKENGELLPTDEWGEKGEDPDYSPRIDMGVAEKIRESIIASAQQCERRQGTLPYGAESVLDKLRKPEISWKHILASEITRAFCDKKTWLPPSRRHVHEEMYFQSSHGDKVKCTVLLDTSGSCTCDLPKFMSEVVSLLNSFSNYDLELIQCDADIQSIEKYDDYNQFPMEDLTKVKFKGFGGSDFCPVFKHFEDSGEYPNILIAFTDSYISVPKDPPPFEVIWVLTSDSNREFCNYGKKIVFKDKKEED